MTTADSVQRAAAAIATVVTRGGSHVEAARAALEAAAPSPAMAERAARLLLTKAGALPEVHLAIGEPERPLCGNPDGPGPGGYTTYTLRATCQGCLDAAGHTEDQLAEWERWTREGVPPEVREQSMTREEVLAYMTSRGT